MVMKFNFANYLQRLKPVPMVLNPHGIEIGFVVAGGGFYTYYNLQCIKLDKVIKNVRKKNQFYAYKQHLTHFLKMGSIPCWVQFHVYR